MIDHARLLQALVPVAREAGAAIERIRRDGALVEAKGDGSPVTAADRAAEKIILDHLGMIAEGIPVVSEENAESHRIAAADRFMLVDPLDGTKEFVKADGKGGYTINIALVEFGEPTLGIVYAPALERMFCGAINTGAQENGAAISVRHVPAAGPVAVASVSHRDPLTDQWLKTNGIEETVAIGSSVKFCLLAAGQADVYPRFGPTMEWDTAAGDAILRAAGGRVDTSDGQPLVYGKPGYRNGPFIARGRMQ